MAVTKNTIEQYTITKKEGRAVICLDSWQRNGQEGKLVNYCGTIQIHSSWGDFAHTWTACGVPFKNFLFDVDFDNFMGKCLSGMHRVYDGEVTYKEIVGTVLARRRKRVIDQFDARVVYNELVERRLQIECSLNDMVYAVRGLWQNVDRKDFSWLTSEPWEYSRKKKCSQAYGFWLEIWPEFIAALKAETDVAKDEMMAVA